ncbi:60s acidic ribosomal protein-domain-containing protein [Coniella lustricola]|uniref:60s acidic ribosomal protein-domain-containing protein n=1 Tax=Coniella lustricola TaxID=2025994 RepID=A0A2T3AAS7_9PEZI|nr:60s acidic ribosomal protein-domain-containing protein [Coniella lustricola]
MKHLAAYLLLTLGGNEKPSAADIKSVLESVGIESDSGRLDKLISELEGKDINELISEGSSKLASVPSGGAGAAASGGAAAAGGAADAPAEEAKEEGKFDHLNCSMKVRQIQTLMSTTEKEESDDDMGFGLFD